MVKGKLYRQKSQKDAYTHPLRKREKGKIYISICKNKRKRATKSVSKSTNGNKF